MKMILDNEHTGPSSNRLIQGEETIKKITNSKDYEEMGISTAMKLFFSMIDPIPIVEGQSLIGKMVGGRLHSTAISVANGLLLRVDKKTINLYPFTKESQNLLHQKVLEKIAHSHQSPVDVVNELLIHHHSWFDYFISNNRISIEERLVSLHNKEIKKIWRDARKPFKGNVRKKFYLPSIRNFYPMLTDEQLIDLNKMINKYEIDYKELARNLNYKIRALQDEYRDIKKRNLSHDELKELKTTHKAEISKLESENIRKLHSFTEKVEIDISDKFDINFNYNRILGGVETLFLENFEKYLIDGHIMSREQIDRYYTFHDTVRRISNELIRINTEYRHKTNTLVHFTGKTFRRFNIFQIGSKYNLSNAFNVDEIKTVVHNIIEAINNEAGICYYNSYNREKYRELPKKYFPHKYNHKLDKVKKDFNRCFNVLLDNDIGPIDDLYNELIELSEEYYGELYPKYKEEYRLWGPIATREHELALKTTKALSEEFQKGLREKIIKESDIEIQQIFQQFIKLFTKIDKNVRRVIIIPTGFIFVTDDNEFLTAGFSPVDTIVKNGMNDKQWDDWQYSWITFYNTDIDYQTKKIDSFNKIVRQIINEEIMKMMITKNVMLQPFEEELITLCEKYQLQLPWAISKQSGVFNAPINEKEVESLKKILPQYGRFFNKITTGDSKITIDSLALSIKSFMSGDLSSTGGFITSDENGIQLDITSLMLLLSEVNDEIESIQPYIASALAAEIYMGLNPHLVEEFNRLVESSLEISKLTFYRFSGKRIDSPVERRIYMSRVLFLIEFPKYLAGEQDGELLEFMKKIDMGL